MTRFYHNYSPFFRLTSASRHFFRILRTALLLTAVVFVFSCEEGPTKIGSELLPSNDFVTINSTDTLSVWSYNMYNSSVPSSSPSVAFVGNIYDSYFGTTTAEFVSQLRLSNVWNYGPVTIDSVKLNLRLISVSGGTTDAGQFIKLSEISDELIPDSTYYSDTPTETTGFEVTVQLPTIRPDSTTHIASISVSLPVEFGEYLTRDTTQLFYSTTEPDFRSFFKGLYFRIPDSGDPLMCAFSLVSDIASGGGYNNYFVLYMHDTANISQRYYFILDPVHPNVCYNRFIRDFSTAEPDKQIQHINDYTYRDTLTYLQYLNGVYTKIIFPGLDSLRMKFADKRISVNKARIKIPAYYDGVKYTAETVPQSLRLRYIDSVGVSKDVPDYSLDTGSEFFDGTLHVLDSSYYFNIPTYIQTFLEDKTDKFLPELEVYQGPAGLNSVILRANKNKNPIKFEMTYTEF